MPLNLRRAPNCRGAFFVVVPAAFHGQGGDQMRTVDCGSGRFVLAGDAFGQHCLNWDEPVREAG